LIKQDKASKGVAYKKNEELHGMTEVNIAFANFRVKKHYSSMSSRYKFRRLFRIYQVLGLIKYYV
jgi:hypothetical protein